VAKSLLENFRGFFAGGGGGGGVAVVVDEGGVEPEPTDVIGVV